MRHVLDETPYVQLFVNSVRHETPNEILTRGTFKCIVNLIVINTSKERGDTMSAFPMPPNDPQRLQALWHMQVLDTKPEERFDRITERAVKELHVPISTISLIDKDREWYKSCQGVGVKELPRNISFCTHAIMSTTPMIVEDTLLDNRFKDNPQVTHSPYIRFYAGIPLRDFQSGLIVGVFCIKDTKPRRLSQEEYTLLFELAQEVEKELLK